MDQKGEDVLITVSGRPFITREEFNRSLSEHGAPQDYSYDEYVKDSTETAEECYERMKWDFIAENPNATPEEYTAEMRRISDWCGV